MECTEGESCVFWFLCITNMPHPKEECGTVSKK